jgi:CubicO group peptidase (beta-lactamase class C family)
MRGYRKRPQEKVRVTVWLSLLLLTPGSGAAQAALTPEPEVVAVPRGVQAHPGPTDPAEVGAFLDGLMAAHLADHGIAGAAVAIVRDGRLLLSKGYGWADVERRVPVDPARTLFRIGSVSKLFTWTAVMQLRDEGRLDLDADVNSYLDFRIPASYPEPITLRHLLTHTAGFEDRSFGLFAPPAQTSRDEWLRRNVPARVRPPGRNAAYSNYGTALAGHIVERVTGTNWEEYVETSILGPLGMAFASPRQPLPEELAPYQSRGYVHRDGSFVAQPFDWIAGPLAPAGSISASAEAMAAFMTLHLQNGSYGGARILADSTVREMQARAFGDDPRINGFTLGFYEKSSHGLRIVGHDGGTQRFFTDLVLIPSERLGIFVAYNSAGGMRLAGRGFLNAVLDHYYPVAPLTRAAPAPGWEARARAFAGSYLPLRRAYTTFEKPIRATMRFRVEAVAPGEIVVRSPSWAVRLTEVEPGYFVSADRSFAASFRDRPGEATHLSLSVMAGMPLERQPFGADLRVHGIVMLGSLLILASGLVLAPARFLLQGRMPEVAPLRGWERGLRWAAIAFGGLAIGFLVAAAAAVGGAERFLTGEAHAALRAALLLPVLALPLAAVVAGGAVHAVRRGYWSRSGRVHYILVAVAAVVFLAQLHYWNLLGWRF